MIRFIEDKNERKTIARQILEALTQWFEVEESREDYINKSQDWPFFASFDGEKPTGFLCLKETGEATVELAVMGVLKDYHRHGLGRKLFAEAKAYAMEQGYSFMQVKTVKYGCYEDYDRTNDFYRSVGFRELEVLDTYWDEANPCQIYVMNLKSALDVIESRRSYRGAYSDESVPREDLMKIASAGVAAPSGCNKQTTDFVVVDDRAVLDRLKAVIDPPVARTAPAMIVVMSRRINAYRDKCYATQDYSAAIENMLLAAVDLGYSSCWYEGHITDEDRICDKIADILNIPEEFDVVCLLPVGKAVDKVNAPVKKPMEERVRFNGWDTRD